MYVISLQWIIRREENEALKMIKEKKRGIFIQFLVGNFSFSLQIQPVSSASTKLLFILNISCDWFVHEKFYGLAYFIDIRFSSNVVIVQENTSAEDCFNFPLNSWLWSLRFCNIVTNCSSFIIFVLARAILDLFYSVNKPVNSRKCGTYGWSDNLT